MMTSAQVVKTSVSVVTNSPSQDYNHLDNRIIQTYDMTPGFKPFTVKHCLYIYIFHDVYRVKNLVVARSPVAIKKCPGRLKVEV